MIMRQGSGARPKSTDQVRVNYHGTLLDGTVFDSSYDRGQPAEFALNQVIAGWTEGLSMMPVGSKFRFWIPGELAYGPKGTPGGPIGPNATLVFDVELMSILSDFERYVYRSVRCWQFVRLSGGVAPSHAVVRYPEFRPRCRTPISLSSIQ
jgi:hypothetical protein